MDALLRLPLILMELFQLFQQLLQLVVAVDHRILVMQPADRADLVAVAVIHGPAFT